MDIKDGPKTGKAAEFASPSPKILPGKVSKRPWAGGHATGEVLPMILCDRGYGANKASPLSKGVPSLAERARINPYMMLETGMDGATLASRRAKGNQ
jgi:hypothetical protein